MAYSYFLGCSYSHGFHNMTSFQDIPRTALCARGFNGTDSDSLGRTEGVKVHVVARVQSAPTSKERYIKNGRRRCEQVDSLFVPLSLSFLIQSQI